MTSIQSADHQPDDRFGYGCYALVIPASPQIAATCARLERGAKMTRAKIPAHVTVKGTFINIDDLSLVRERTRAITDQVVPFDIPFAGAQSVWWDTGGALAVLVTPDLQALHDALVAAIAPLGQPAYQDDPYRPHMTYVQSISPEALQWVRAQVAEMDFGAGFRAEFVDLMGRKGPAEGGAWHTIERFPLQG